MNKITLDFFQVKSTATIKGLLVLFAFLFLNPQASWGQISITGTGSGNTYSQNFDALANTGTAEITTLPVGWTFLETGTGANTTYAAGTGSLNTGNTYSYGDAASTDRAFGGLQSGGVIPTLGASFTNNSGGTITEMVISYTGEQWRLGTLNRVDRLDFQYSLNATSLSTGTWTDVDNLDFTAPVTTGTLGAIVGNTPGNKTSISYTITGLSIASGTTFWLRFNDLNATGADDGLAVDDFSLYVVGGAVTSTTWDGTAWSNGAPTSTIDAIIAGNYSTGANAINAKSVTVNSGTLTVNASGSLTIQNELNNVGGSVIVENNANLIQVSNISNTGEITVNRNGASLMLLDYSLWSSPVSGQKLKAFSPNTLDNRFYTYNPTTNIYVPVAAPATTDFASGNGYLIRVPNDHPTTPTIWSGIFRGVPNNGNISVSGLTSGTFNAVGNPYPSTISADAFITANNLTEPLYFWRKTNAAAGTAYATYTMAGAVGTPGNGGITPNGTIQVGQGFIVKTNSNSIAFANTMRTANTANQILRTATTEKNRIWLNLSKGNEPVNQMMVAYMDGATSEIDNTLDGRYINDNETALTSSLKGEEFVIQAKGLPFDSSDIVPLSFKTELAGSFTIAIDKVDGLFLGNQEIVLKDLKSGTEQNLKTGSYTFTSEAGTFKNRFEIAFKNNQTLDINTPNFDENSVIVFNQNGTLNVSTVENKIKSIRVFDMRGVLITEQKDVNANSAIIKNVTANKQAVLIQIISEDNKTVTKKAIF